MVRWKQAEIYRVRRERNDKIELLEREIKFNQTCLDDIKAVSPGSDLLDGLGKLKTVYDAKNEKYRVLLYYDHLNCAVFNVYSKMLQFSGIENATKDGGNQSRSSSASREPRLVFLILAFFTHIKLGQFVQEVIDHLKAGKDRDAAISEACGLYYPDLHLKRHRLHRKLRKESKTA